jgi:hypothetical protein
MNAPSIILDTSLDGLRMQITTALEALRFEAYSGQTIKSELDKVFTTVQKWRDAYLKQYPGALAECHHLFAHDIAPEIEATLDACAKVLELKRLAGGV